MQHEAEHSRALRVSDLPHPWSSYIFNSYKEGGRRRGHAQDVSPGVAPNYVYRRGQSICASVVFIYTIGRIAFSSQFCRVNREVMNKY